MQSVTHPRRESSSLTWFGGVPIRTVFKGWWIINDRDIVISLNTIAKRPYSYKHSHAQKTFQDICGCLTTQRVHL